MDKPDLYVVARFLEILYNSGTPMKKTNIQRLLGLRYPRFTEYLDWLLEHRLVEKAPDEDNVERVALTPKGINSYHKLVAWIKETMEGIRI
jgi:predicted transcriptional regulator